MNQISDSVNIEIVTTPKLKNFVKFISLRSQLFIENICYTTNSNKYKRLKKTIFHKTALR